MQKITIFALVLTAFTSCIKDTATTTDNNSEKNINFSLKFDPTQARLGNAGQIVSVLPTGNAGQNPAFKTMAVHFIELCPDSTSALSTSSVNLPNISILLYKGVEVNNGGVAIDFDQLKKAAQGEKFFSAPIKGIKAGTYKFIRVSVAYQNYDILYNLNNIPVIGNLPNQKARVASFLGFNSYIRKATINTKDTTINGNRAQGFGLSESTISINSPIIYSRTILGGWQSAGTTVVNPVAQSLVGLPLNSCLIQGKLAKPLVITGNETADINAILSFSTNKSFEWRDTNGNGQLDFDATTPANSEKVVDMGLRGLIATWQ